MRVAVNIYNKQLIFYMY